MVTDDIRQAAIWDAMPHVSLEEIKSVRLMSRIDTKFVAHRRQLPLLLEEAQRHGYMVQYTSSAVNAYDTTYFDTDDLEMYTLHHNRKLCRQKVRCRTYVESGISFLEIKNKSNKGRTRKIRIAVNDPSPQHLVESTSALDFVGENTPYSLPELQPSLRTRFDRITLVNPEKTERLTIDLNLRFDNPVSRQSDSLPRIIIIELKQDGHYTSTLRRILLDLRIKPFKISKYCIGTALTRPTAKINRFKRKIHLINKLSDTES